MQYINDNIIFGLDIGTRSIVGLVGYKNSNGFNVIASHMEFHRTRSMFDGQIHDIENVAETIRRVKDALEIKTGKQLKKVCIAAAGRVLKTLQIHVETDIEDSVEIDRELVYSLELQGMEKAMHQINYTQGSRDMPFYCVGYSVTNYYLNGYVMKKLDGQKGSTIGADILSTFLPSEVVGSLYKVVEKAGLEVYSLTLEPIAAIEVAIPENFRLLNIALVDIGAGTSDIAITLSGSIVAYGMIPLAGDEITESVAHKYLVDFKTAEKIKIKASGTKKIVSFMDAMGIKQHVEFEDVRRTMKAAKENLAREIAEKIRDMNGGVATNAVFIVGGGGQVNGFEKALADELDIPRERVAIRGEDVLEFVITEDEDFSKSPEYVTPVGICLTGLYNNRHDFVEVFLNDETIKIFNTNRLTVMDVVALKGIDPKDFIGRRGKALSYRLNGENHVLKGEMGTPARIYVNNKEGSLSTHVKVHDYINLIPAKDGKTPEVSVKDVIGKNEVTVNGDRKLVELKTCINSVTKSPLTTIRDGDDILVDYPEIGPVLDGFSIECNRIFVNEEEVDRGYVLKPGDTVQTFYDEDFKQDEDFMRDEDYMQDEDSLMEEDSVKYENNEISVLNKQDSNPDAPFKVLVNDQLIEMSGKDEYSFIDIFEHYEFDRSKARGKLVTMINGQNASYMDPIRSLDKLDLYWQEID